MPDLVTVQKLNHYGICTLNLPHKRNPISAEMRAALIAALDDLANSANVRSVIITGAGSAFCSGLDLETLAQQLQKSPAEHLADSQSIADFFHAIAHYPKPTIAAVNGPAVAGGAGLAVLCDFTLLSADAFLSFSEVKIGFVPAIVGVYLERIVGPKVGRDVLLTGRKITSTDALRMGLATAVAPAADLLNEAVEMAHVLAQNSPVALAQTKELLVRASGANLDDSLSLAVRVNATARTTSECHEGVNAFLEKRLPSWAQTV